jgi:glycosyltransferase involved in cell wall biosynthesis
MAGPAWGGSEELWAAAAHCALRKGIGVSVYIRRPYTSHRKWLELRRSGAELTSDSSSSWIRARVLGRADLLHHRVGRYLRTKPFRAFLAGNFDVVLVSDGANCPPAEVIDAVNECASKRYVILSQSNAGNIFEDDGYRRKLARFYQGAFISLFVSEANLKMTERQLAHKLPNARVIRNPVSLESLDPLPWPSEEQIAFACVARLKPAHKGQDILLEALSDARWRKRHWRLTLYGTGPDATYLRELSEHFGLRDRVSFFGQTEDIRAIWQTHHALLLPSRLEGMPLAVVEAMICGRPVVGTSIGGMPEWIRDGRNGFLACAPTGEAYAEALERAWRRRSEWQEIGREARLNALRLHDPAPGDTLLSILLQAERAGQASDYPNGRIHSTAALSLPAQSKAALDSETE